MKKIIFLSLIFILMSTSTHLFCQVQPGDVNEDDEVNIIDALLVAQYYVGMPGIQLNLEAAEVSDDGVVDIIDALLIAQFYVGLITEFPVQTGATPTPEVTPTPETPEATPILTPGPVNEYMLHIECKGDTLDPGVLIVPMSYSGDYSGSYIQTPFAIGPYPEPFTVTLTTPINSWYSGLFLFHIWQLDGTYLSTSSTSCTVTVNTDNPERTLIAHYYDDMAAMTPVPTTVPTPDP